MSFQTQPYIYGSTTARKRLRKILDDAKSTSVVGQHKKILIVGNSTSTSPGGAGVAWVPYFTLLLASWYGNLPASQLLIAGNASECIGGRSSVSNGTTATSVVTALGPTCQIPPSVAIQNFSSTALGLSACAYHDCHNINRALLPNTSGLFPSTGTYFEVFAPAKSGFGELAYEIKPTADRALASYYAATTVSGTTALNLNEDPEAGKVKIKKQILGPFTNTSTYLQIILKAATAATDIIGGRWLNPNPVGVGVDTFSAGGYQCYHWFGHPSDGTASNHKACASFLGQMDFDIVIFLMSTNDAFSGGRNAATYKSYLWNDMSAGQVNRGLVGEIKKAFADAGKNPEIILAQEPYRCRQIPGGSDDANHTTRLAYFDAYAEKFVEIADAIDCVYLNTYRATWERGWSATSDEFYGCVFKGDWRVGQTYAIGDVVYYLPGSQNIAAFSSGSNYAVGDIVRYTDDLLYRANGTITAGTAWATGTSGATWSLYIPTHTTIELPFFKATKAGTADAALNNPVGGSQGPAYWARHRDHLVDNVHFADAGGVKFAETMKDLLLHAAYQDIAYAGVGDVLNSVDRGDGITGSYVAPSQTHYLDTGSGYGAGGATVGTATLTTANNVRSGTTFGVDGTSITGTLAVPNPNRVLADTPTDNTTGTLTIPDEDEVADGVEYGIGGTGSTGTATILPPPSTDDQVQCILTTRDDFGSYEPDENVVILLAGGNGVAPGSAFAHTANGHTFTSDSNGQIVLNLVKGSYIKYWRADNPSIVGEFTVQTNAVGPLYINSV